MTISSVPKSYKSYLDCARSAVTSQDAEKNLQLSFLGAADLLTPSTPSRRASPGSFGMRSDDFPPLREVMEPSQQEYVQLGQRDFCRFGPKIIIGDKHFVKYRSVIYIFIIHKGIYI